MTLDDQDIPPDQDCADPRPTHGGKGGRQILRAVYREVMESERE
jgi:hypothetical protein